jgi:ABC-type antimicrobial peptide transport system permease subunit
VADVKYTRVNAPPRPYFYLPFAQSYRSTLILHARSASGAVEPLIERTRVHIEALDANLPVLSVRPMDETTRGAFIFYDLTATMLFLFGAAGMLLAVMGTYGLVAYVVRQSTREIGIRIALGASRLSVVRGFVSRGLRLGVVGAVVGVVAALGVAQLLRNVLYGVSATDVVSFGTALAIVLGGVVLATVIPAWHAARTDALTALRHQ